MPSEQAPARDGAKIGRPTPWRVRLARWWMLLPFALALSGPSLASPASRFDLQTVADARAVPNGIVTALAEDADGLMWVGSTNGLLRFDGYRLVNESERDTALPRAYVQALLAARDGTLWVGLQGDGVWRRDPVSGRFEAVGGDLAAGGRVGSAVLAMAEDAEGGIWIGDARDGVRRFDASGRVDPQVHLLPGQSVRTVLVDRRGDLWMGHRDGLMRKRAGRRSLESLPGLEGRYVYALHEASNGRLWIGMQADGAAVLDPVSGTIRHLPSARQADGVGHPWVDSFAERVPGEMWVSTFGGGVEVRDLQTHRLRGRLRADPGRAGSLAVDRVQSLLRDRVGQLWFATWGGGLQRLPPGAEVIERLPAGPDGLRHPTITSSLEWPDGLLWLGSGAFGVDEVDPSTLRVRRSFAIGAGVADGTVRALERTADGQVWAGVQEGGIWRAAGRDAPFAPVSEDWEERRVRVIAPAAEGGIWVGLERGVRRVLADGRSEAPLVRSDGTPFDEVVWAIAEDPSGALWVGTPIGLWVRPSGTVGLREHVTESGPRSGPRTGVLMLRIGRDGGLWMLARDGLHVMESPSPSGRFVQRIEARSQAQGLGEQLVEDERGVLWTGRVRFDPATDHLQALGPADGMDVANQVWGASRLLADGRLVLGSSTGLVLLDTRRFEPWRFQPRVVVSAIELDGELVRATAEGVRVPPGRHRIAVEFAALDYSEPAALRYRYRLDGQDERWVLTDASQRVAAYGNLWPGDYLLQVQGSNRVGEWSPHVLELPVVVEAAFWQTGGFAVLVFAALALSVHALVRWRLARAAARSRELAELVEQRTAELVEARDTAEAALVELRGAQGQLVEAEKMASLGQMVAGVAHELNTPLGNALVVSSTLQEQAQAVARSVAEGRLKRSELDGFLKVLGEGSELVVRSIGRAHDLVSSFKQVAVDRSSSKRRRFDLRMVVGEALAMVGPSMRHHRCEVESRVPPGIVMDSYPGAINQIVSNMVNNAVLHAFGDDGTGRLLIEAHVREGLRGSEVVLEFIDDGVGMDDATRRRVFDPFFTTRMGRGGTGLGLNIVYNLVGQLLGGSISVDSVPGKGTRFELVLPMAAPASAEEAVSP